MLLLLLHSIERNMRVCACQLSLFYTLADAHVTLRTLSHRFNAFNPTRAASHSAATITFARIAGIITASVLAHAADNDIIYGKAHMLCANRTTRFPRPSDRKITMRPLFSAKWILRILLDTCLTLPLMPARCAYLSAPKHPHISHYNTRLCNDNTSHKQRQSTYEILAKI